MTLAGINDTAPDFEAETTQGRSVFTNGRQFLGRLVLASQGLHPGLHHRARLHGEIKPEFDKRNVKIIGLSVDPLDRHSSWAAT